MPSLLPSSPVVYSVIAVFLWGAADFSGGCGSRRANAFVVTAFSHICAFVVMTIVALSQGGAFPDRTSILWTLAAGAIGGFSLAIFYGALASGQMGLSAPIAALLGAAIPTLVDIALEGAPSRWSVAGFALAIVAIWLITRPDASPEAVSSSDLQPVDPEKAALAESSRPKGIATAALAGVGFAGFYLCIHQASGSPVWIAVVSRVGSFTATAVAIAVLRPPIRLDRSSALLGMVAGVFDITASALFISAAHRGRLDDAVVITSLYPAVTVVLARLFLREHLSRWKLVGMLAALAAVPLISAG